MHATDSKLTWSLLSSVHEQLHMCQIIKSEEFGLFRSLFLTTS